MHEEWDATSRTPRARQFAAAVAGLVTASRDALVYGPRVQRSPWPVILSFGLTLAACDIVTFTNGAPVNTKAVAAKATEVLKTGGFPLQSLTCPDEFSYRKGHDVLMCQATMVGGLVVDAPVTFSDAANFEVKPHLPDEITAKGSELMAQATGAYGNGVTLVCPPLLVFWKGRDTVNCQLAVEGQTDDLVMSVGDGRVRAKPSPERYIDAAQVAADFVRLFQGLSLAAEVDCGQPRLILRKERRKLECTATWEGGHARIVNVFTGSTTDSFVPLETEGLRGPQLEALLALYIEPAAGNAWSCREGTQLVRGQPFSCDFVVAGRKRTRTRFLPQEDRGSFDVNPVPLPKDVSPRATP